MIAELRPTELRQIKHYDTLCRRTAKNEAALKSLEAVIRDFLPGVEVHNNALILDKAFFCYRSQEAMKDKIGQLF